MTNNESRGLRRLIFLIVVMTVILFFSKGSITGYLNKDIERQVIDFVVDRSQSFVVSLPNSEQLNLHSFSVSGDVAGSGKVQIFLDNGQGVRRLVFANVQGFGKSLDTATEFVDVKNSGLNELIIAPYRNLDDEVFGGGETIAGYFRNVCSETCELDPELFASQRYELLVYVEPGTKVHLTEVLYGEGG